MGKTRKEEKDFIRTDLGRRLYDYNNENTGYSESEISDFLSGNSRVRNNQIFGVESQEQEDYLGGVNPLGDYIDFDPSKYDGDGLHESQLWNAEDFRSQNQGIFDSLARSTANLAGKTAINVVGGLTGLAYGGAQAIQSGRVSDLWDNDLTTALDKASEAVGDYFKVYKSNDFEQRNLIERAVLNPIQFTDSVMDTLSFTTGAILTEMISGGLASGLVIPRALKYFKSLDNVADAAQAGSQLANSSTAFLRGLENAGTLTRQLATGAAYEASVEARHAGMELRDNLYNQWLEENPGLSIEDMPEEDRNAIDDRLSNAGLFTFLTNMALVGGSNILQFPKVFGAGYNTAKRAEDLSGRIIRDASGEFIDSAIPTTRAGRVLSTALTAARNPFYEGIVEEGGQGVISGLSSSFFARKFDGDSIQTVQDFLSDFGKSLAETYTTAEGWEEIGMGMIIGSLGAPSRGALSILGKNNRLGQQGFNEDGTRREIWGGGIYGAFQERNEQTARIAEYIEELNQNTSLMDSMKANYDFLVQSDSLDKSMNLALQLEDVFNYNNFRDDKVHAYIASRLKSGLASDLDTTVEQLNRMSPEQLYAEFRGQEEADKASDEVKREFKTQAINEFKQKIQATIGAYDNVDAVYTGDNSEIRDYFAHAIATAKYADFREKAINKQLSDLSNGAINNLHLRGSDTVSIQDEINRLTELTKDPEVSSEEKTNIREVLKAYNNIKDKQRSLTISEYESLVRMNEVDPVTLSLNLDKITELLNDSRKLRERRQHLINSYNDMFTEEGIKRTQRKQREFMEEQERLAAEEQAEIERQEAEQAALDEELRVEARKSEIKANKEAAAEVKKTEMAEEATEEIPVTEEVDTTPIEESSDIDELSFAPATLLDEDGEIVQESAETASEEAVEPLSEEPSIVSDLDSNSPEVQAVLTNIENEEVSEEKNTVKQDGYVKTPDTDKSTHVKASVISHNDWIKREVGNTITSLNVDYNHLVEVKNGKIVTSIKDSTGDEGRLEINSNFDSRLQDPSQFTIGDTVNIIIPTYEQIVARGISGDGYTQEQYNTHSKDIDMFPVAFTDNNGKIIGYLPTKTNVENNVDSRYVKEELASNRALREEIYNNRDSNMTATITDKKSGVPMFQRYEQSIYDAMGDGTRLADNSSIGIYKEGKLQVGQNVVFSGNIKLPPNIPADAYFDEGYVYTIIPTAVEDEYYAFPAEVSTIGEKGANTIIKMLELYKATDRIPGDAPLLAERSSLSLETDFSNFKETMAAIESLIYVNNDNDNYMLRLDNNKLILGVTPDMQFTWKSFRNQATKDKVRKILANRYHAVRLANFGNSFNSYEVGDNGELNIVDNLNYNDYLNNNRVLTTNVQSEPIEGTANKRYFTAQSVIEIGNVRVEPKQLNESQQSVKTRTSNIDTGINNPYTDRYLVDNEILDKETGALILDFESNNEALSYFLDNYVNTSDTSGTTTPITTQEADIERRRREELDKTEKYTLNRANTEKTLAPEININEIDLDKSGLEDFDSEVKSVNVLEYRGRNAEGVRVGTVRITGTTKEGDFFAEVFEVFFKDDEINAKYDAELAQLRGSNRTSGAQTSANTTEAKEAPKKARNRLGLKVPKRGNRDRLNEDFAEINNPNISLDQQTELLMKKCQ